MFRLMKYLLKIYLKRLNYQNQKTIKICKLTYLKNNDLSFLEKEIMHMNNYDNILYHCDASLSTQLKSVFEYK